ncbi:hypothetical protein D8780_04215 [Notoacmeibacter ruber]|uniref:DUF1441 family protein n=2 Tax=Notoacmeibacter ruber TaxID=2670375 RepID=A0A3L7JAQ5_9HYPH|nr:hypothetical protein D8780_04215 [Notoacmeibacter ruber]
MRAWAEHIPFDYAAAAEMSGLKEHSIRGKASKQGWIIRQGHRGRAGEAELARLRDRLWARLDAATDRAIGEPLPKADIDAIHVLLRAVDKLETACERADTGVRPEETEKLTAVLARINDRIVELAGEMAERQTGEEPPTSLAAGSDDRS